LILLFSDLIPKRHLPEGLSHLFIRVCAEGIDVALDSAREKSGVLRDDCYVVTERMKTQI
jgi:hypothetical protein